MEFLEELRVEMSPQTNILKEQLLAPLNIHKNNVVLGILEPTKVSLKQLDCLGNVDVLPATITDAPKTEVESLSDFLIALIRDAELVFDGVVLGELLVDALIVLEHLVKVKNIRVSKKACDLVLQDVLWERGEDRHLGLQGG